MKTGAIFSGYSSRDLQGVQLFKALPRIPGIPPACDWSEKMTKPIGFLGNNTLRDCCFASIGHLCNLYLGVHGKKTDVTEAEIKRDYLDHTNGQDVGAELRAVLTRFKGKNDLAIAKHRCAAFVRLNHRDIDTLRAAIYLFGGVYAAVQGPSNLTDMETWKVEAPRWRPDPSMGHCIPLVGFGQKHFVAASWNALPVMSLGYQQKYMVEAWAVVSAEWFYPGGIAPLSNMKLADVTQALASIAA